MDDDAYVAFRKFAENRLNVIPVVEKGKLLGLVSRKKIMHRLVWEMKFGKLDGMRSKIKRKRK